MLVTQADPARLAQVLDNILLNAVKFSPECAPIEMDVRGDGNTIVVTIVDHGEGMPADELEHIFERYYRKARQGRPIPGARIGLAVACEIIAAHEGRISAASEGQGPQAPFSFRRRRSCSGTP